MVRPLKDNGLKSGTVVGQWTLLKYMPGQSAPPRSNAAWYCRCSCGVKQIVVTANLLAGRSTRCRKCAAVAQKARFKAAREALTAEPVASQSGRTKELS